MTDRLWHWPLALAVIAVVLAFGVPLIIMTRPRRRPQRAQPHAGRHRHRS